MKKPPTEIRRDLTTLISMIETYRNSNSSLATNPGAIKKIFDFAKSIDVFKNIVNLSVDTTQVLSGRKQIIQSEFNSIQQEIDKNLTDIYNLSEILIQMLDDIIPSDAIESINIKFTKINDFDDLAKFSKDIQMALSQVILDKEINGEIKISRVESGSILFNVFIGALAVQVVASLVWSAAVVCKKMLEVQLLQKQIRGLKIKNETLEDVLSAIKEETKLALQAEAEFVNSEHFKEHNAENIERIKNSINIFSELIIKGTEITPALSAPETVSNLFPDMKQLTGIESKIKQIKG